MLLRTKYRVSPDLSSTKARLRSDYGFPTATAIWSYHSFGMSGPTLYGIIWRALRQARFCRNQSSSTETPKPLTGDEAPLRHRLYRPPWPPFTCAVIPRTRDYVGMSLCWISSILLPEPPACPCSGHPTVRLGISLFESEETSVNDLVAIDESRADHSVVGVAHIFTDPD